VDALVQSTQASSSAGGQPELEYVETVESDDDADREENEKRRRRRNEDQIEEELNVYVME